MQAVVKMLYLKQILLSLFILLLTVTPHKPKETFKDIVFYVTDPNGIFLFSDPRDIGKRIAVPYKTKLVSLGTEKISLPSKNNEEEEKYFEKLLYKEKVYYVEEDNSNKFIKLEPPNSDLYTYTQVPNATIYSLPFKDSKVIKKLPEFSMLEVISSNIRFAGNQSDSFRFSEPIVWTEVEFGENVKGFILDEEILSPYFQWYIQKSLKNKVKDKKGIFQVTVDKPEIFKTLENIEQAKSVDLDDRNYLPKKGMYSEVMESLEKEGIRYYKITRLNLRHALLLQAYGGKKLEDSEIYFWVSEKQGTFFSNTEFARHSFQNSKYKKDTQLFKIFEWRYSGAVNYDTLKLWKYFSKKYSSEFYLINFQYGIDGNFYYLIIERKANQFKELFGGLENTIALEAQAFSTIIGDVDGDGYPEFIGGYRKRGGGVDGVELHTFKNGEIKFIANLSYECNPEFDGKYLSCFSIEEVQGEDGKTTQMKKLLARYKFVKGKLYKEAAKDKWEEVKSVE